LNIIRYSFQNALKSIWREKWINLLTVLSVSIGLSLFCAFIMVSLNMDSVLKRWGKSFGVVVYLSNGTNSEREDSLKKYFSQDPEISDVKYISKEQALKEVRQTLGPNALVLDESGDNPLPASFELTLKSSSLEPSLVKRKAAQIGKMSGVEEVQYGEKWLSSLNAVSKAMKTGTLFLGCAIFAAVTFITYSTIKIFFYRRKDEIETLKLLGATRVFIRLPFLLEGIFIGTIGGLISSLVIYSAYSFAILRIAEFMPSIRASMASLPAAAYILIPFAGALMGLTGSFIAVGKIKY